MVGSKRGIKLTRGQGLIVIVLALIVGIPLTLWQRRAAHERARAQAAERLARRAAETAAIEAERARLARRAERDRASQRIRQLHDEIDALTQRDQKLIESSRRPYAGLDAAVKRTSGARP